MVMKPEPWGDALDAVLAARTERRAPCWSCPRRRAAVHPGDGGGARGASRAWCSPAGATRASTAGASRSRGPGCRSTRCRSATTCWPAARSPSWSWSRPSPGCCPGVLGNAESAGRGRRHVGRRCSRARSTPSRPSWRGREVPTVLLSGDHGAIARWRRDEALRRTAALRPDLVAALDPAALDGPTVRCWPSSAGSRTTAGFRREAPCGTLTVGRRCGGSSAGRPRPCRRGSAHRDRLAHPTRPPTDPWVTCGTDEERP